MTTQNNPIAVLTETAGGLTAAQRRDAILAKARERLANGDVPAPRGSGKVFANLDGNTGNLTIGREAKEIPAGQRFVMPLEMATRGQVYWENKQKLRERMAPVLEGPEPQAPAGETRQGSLPGAKSRDGWGRTVSLSFCGVGGELDGIIIVLDCSNQSALGAADDLLRTCILQTATPIGQRGLFNPVIELGVSSYFNKAYSKEVYFPVFKIVGWTDGTETVDVDASASAIAGPTMDDVLG